MVFCPCSKCNMLQSEGDHLNQTPKLVHRVTLKWNGTQTEPLKLTARENKEFNYQMRTFVLETLVFVSYHIGSKVRVCFPREHRRGKEQWERLLGGDASFFFFTTHCSRIDSSISHMTTIFYINCFSQMEDKK